MRDAQVRRLPAVNGVGPSGWHHLNRRSRARRAERPSRCRRSERRRVPCRWSRRTAGARPRQPVQVARRGRSSVCGGPGRQRGSAGINRWWSRKPVPVEGPPRARGPNRSACCCPCCRWVHPGRGDQTNVRYILIRADGPGRQSCPLRRSVQLRPKARGDRSATQEAQAQRKAVPRVRRTEQTQARNVFAVCRDSNGWLVRPAGACWLERKPCGSFIRHRARKHPTGGGMSRRLSGCDRDRRGAKGSPMQHSLTRESGIGARQMSRADVVSDDRRRVMAVTFRAANCHSVRSSGTTAYLKLNVATIVVRPGDRGAQEAAQHEPPGSDGRG